MAATETIPFQAETRKLLDLVIHSLYTHKDIFLRELISNASDALDKLRVEALTDSDLSVDPGRLKIRLEVDPRARTLTVSDNGIGMSRDEVIENIGTIARSGTAAVARALAESEERGTALPELIGQFGVGFYSAFMVADEVELVTRRVGSPPEAAVRWRSRGAGEFEVEDAVRDEHGTTVVLHLKPLDAGDEAARDYTRPEVLREIVRRYSDFIEYPIELLEPSEGDEGEGTVSTLNSRKPLWTRAKEEIEEAEYAEFYRHVSHDWNDPLEVIHFKAEGTTEYTALLYIPSQRPLDLFDPARLGSRLHLYVRRVFITTECEELLPPWLRFVRGVVDAADLPLNVSRETLQHDRRMAQIRRRLTRKVLDALAAMKRERPEDYAKFWKAFGPVVKEGLYHSDEHREEIASLALFPSTAGEELRGLDAYVDDMPVKQKDIYVLPARDLQTARSSPHLEAFRKMGAEVLFLTDPVDDFVLQKLTSYREKPIRRIDQGEIDLGDDIDDAERQAREKELEPLFEAVRKELAESVREVRASTRLTDSPACLVAAEGELPDSLVRLLREQGQEVPEPKRILELNPTHPLVERLGVLREADPAAFAESCEVLLGLAELAGGGTPRDPARFTRFVAARLAADDPQESSA